MQRDRESQNAVGRVDLKARWERTRLLGILFSVFAFPEFCLAYSGGSGTLNAPYVIATTDDLLQLGHSPRDYDKHFLLAHDIDLGEYAFDRAVIAPYTGDDRHYLLHLDHPIEGSFRGTMNGNGHVIRNLTISGRGVLGLFGIIGNEARIYGLGVVDANVAGLEESVGMLAGHNEGVIDSCYASGIVRANAGVGGLAGSHRGFIRNSFAAGDVHGTTWDIGGLVGNAVKRPSDYTGIAHCYSICRLYGIEGRVGGVTGIGLEVTHSYWDTQLSGITSTRPDSGGTGLRTEQMHSATTYLEGGWDFVGEEENGCREIWVIPPSGGYPQLSVFLNLSPPHSISCAKQNMGNCMLFPEANDVLWNASEFFSSRWETVTTTKTTWRREMETLHAVVTIEGYIDILDTNNVIGMDTENSVVCRAIDGEGRELSLCNTVNPLEPNHDWDMRNPHPKPISLALWLDPNETGFDSLSQVDFYVYALYGQSLMIDIPFAVMDDWLEIAPGLKVIIETAISDEGVCRYNMREKYITVNFSDGLIELTQENTLVSDLYHTYSREPISQMDLIYSVAFLDASGNPTAYRYGSTGHGGGGTERSRSGNWSECSGIGFVRYTLIPKPRAVRVPLTVRDVLVAD